MSSPLPPRVACAAVWCCLALSPVVMAKGMLERPGRAAFPSVFSLQWVWKLRTKAPLSLALLGQQMPWAQGRTHFKRAAALLVATGAICLWSPAHDVSSMCCLPVLAGHVSFPAEPACPGGEGQSPPGWRGFLDRSLVKPLFDIGLDVILCRETRVLLWSQEEQERWFCPSGLFSSEGQWSSTDLSPVSGWEFF